MRINKEELKSLADKLQIEINEEELNQINDSISEITDKLEEILKVDTDNIDPLFINSEQEYNVNVKDADDCDLSIDMNKINNYDGQYVKLERGDDE